MLHRGFEPLWEWELAGHCSGCLFHRLKVLLYSLGSYFKRLQLNTLFSTLPYLLEIGNGSTLLYTTHNTVPTARRSINNNTVPVGQPSASTSTSTCTYWSTPRQVQKYNASTLLSRTQGYLKNLSFFVSKFERVLLYNILPYKVKIILYHKYFANQRLKGHMLWRWQQQDIMENSSCPDFPKIPDYLKTISDYPKTISDYIPKIPKTIPDVRDYPKTIRDYSLWVSKNHSVLYCAFIVHQILIDEWFDSHKTCFTCLHVHPACKKCFTCSPSLTRPDI